MQRKSILIAVAGLAAGLATLWLLIPAPVEVDASTVARGAMTVTVDDIGETRSHDRYLLSSPVAGRLARIDLHEGDLVNEHQIVARVAPLPLSTRERDELTARLSAAQALEREADQRERHAQADLAQARRELERVQRLVHDGFLSQQAAEHAANQAVTAASEAQAARFRATAAAADVDVARAGLAAARTTRAADAAWIPIRAPMSGHVLRIIDPSERVVTAGAPLLTLGNLRQLEVVVDLLSSDAVKVAPGMPVMLEGWGGAQTLRAIVRRVEPHAVTKVSALGIEEKRVNVIADFVDPPGRIGDGYRVTARVVLWQSEDVIKVPVSALFRCDRQWCVFVIEAGRARRRPVNIDHRNMTEAEALSGVEPGQPVIRYPGNALVDGARVRMRVRHGD